MSLMEFGGSMDNFWDKWVGESVGSLKTAIRYTMAHLWMISTLRAGLVSLITIIPKHLTSFFKGLVYRWWIKSMILLLNLMCGNIFSITCVNIVSTTIWYYFSETVNTTLQLCCILILDHLFWLIHLILQLFYETLLFTLDFVLYSC